MGGHDAGAGRRVVPGWGVGANPRQRVVSVVSAAGVIVIAVSLNAKPRKEVTVMRKLSSAVTRMFLVAAPALFVLIETAGVRNP